MTTPARPTRCVNLFAFALLLLLAGRLATADVGKVPGGVEDINAF